MRMISRNYPIVTCNIPVRRRERRQPLNFSMQKQSFLTERKKQENDVSNTIPCVRKITDVRKSIVYRCFWMIVIVLCFSVCSYQVVSLILKLLQKNETYLMKMTMNDTVSFPAISFTGSFQYPKSKLIKAYVDYATENNLPIKKCAEYFYDLVGFRGINVSDIWEMADNTEIIHSVNIPRAVIEPKEMIVEKKPFLNYYGTGVTVIVRNKMLLEDPASDSLEIKIVPKEDVYCRSYIQIYIHDEAISPRHFITKSGVYIHPNVDILILLSVNKISFLNSKGHPCVDSETFQKCRDECIELNLSKYSPCKLPFMVSSNLSTCATKEETKIAYDNTYYDWLRNYEYFCPQCPRECNKYNFVIQQFKSEGNSTITVRFESNLFQTFTETLKYDLISCLCDIGGNLGLYLGLCIPGILELLEDLLHKFISKLKRKPKKTLIRNITNRATYDKKKSALAGITQLQ